MHGSGILYTPEIVPVIAGGPIPACNVFPFSGVYRDLSGLLANPNANFANDVHDAANGMMTGLVSDGNPEALVSDVLFCGRQAEAARQLEREQRLCEHKAGQADTEKKLQQNNNDNKSLAAEKRTAEHEKQACERGASISNPKPSLPPVASDTISAIGKTIGHFIKSEFVVSLPTAALNTLTPVYTPSSLGAAHNLALAGFHLHF